MSGHGDHWECLYPSVEAFATGRLPMLLEQLPLFAEQPWTDPAESPDGTAADTLFALAERKGPLRHLVLVMGEKAKRSSILVSAYPWAAEGATHEVEIEALLPWKYGIEGQIRGVIADGPEVTFFDPLFFRNRSRYPIGATLPVSFAALAYRVERPERDWVEVAGPTADLLRRPDDPPGPVKVYLTGAAIALPSGGDEDDLSFYATVKAAERFDFADQAVYRMQITLFRHEYMDIDMPLYAAAHTLSDGFSPAPGDDITGALWLQGRLLESA